MDKSGHHNGRKTGVRERGGETRDGQKLTPEGKEDWSERKRGRDEGLGGGGGGEKGERDGK